MKSIMPDNMGITAKVMDLELERQNIVMTNLANINIPSFKARRLEFEKELQGALNRDARGKLSRTEQGHMPSVFDAGTFQGQALEKWKPKVSFGQDAVDLDKEMTIMAKNSLQYNAMTTLVKKEFESVSKAIADGSK